MNLVRLQLYFLTDGLEAVDSLDSIHPHIRLNGPGIRADFRKRKPRLEWKGEHTAILPLVTSPGTICINQLERGDGGDFLSGRISRLCANVEILIRVIFFMIHAQIHLVDGGGIRGRHRHGFGISVDPLMILPGPFFRYQDAAVTGRQRHHQDGGD